MTTGPSPLLAERHIFLLQAGKLAGALNYIHNFDHISIPNRAPPPAAK